MLSPNDKFKQSLKLIDAYYQYIPKDIELYINMKLAKVAVVVEFEYALTEELMQSTYTFIKKEQIIKFLEGTDIKFEEIQNRLDKTNIKPAISLSDRPKCFWELLSDINTWFYK